MEGIKYSLIPTAISGAISAGVTAAVCYIKKLPDKLDKILITPLLVMVPVLFATDIALGIKQDKKDKQNEQNKLSLNA